MSGIEGKINFVRDLKRSLSVLVEALLQ